MPQSDAKIENPDALPDITDLEELIGYNMKRAYVVLQDDFRATLKQDDLSARVFSALSLVVQFPNITQSALAKTLGIERSGLVSIVDDLESRGYLSRAAVPGDRRVQALVPSQAGTKAYREALRKVCEHEEKMMSHLSANEKETLVALLKRIRTGA